MRKRQLITSAVVIALISTIGTIVVAWMNHPVPLPPPTQVPTIPALLFPALRSSYMGHMIRTYDARMFDFHIVQLSEDQMDGNFTAEGATGSCPVEITGSVTTKGNLDFTTKASLICHGIEAHFTGNVNASGSIGGQWAVPNGPFGGSAHGMHCQFS